MKFTKMHGAGNDYIYVDCTQSVIDNPSQVAIDLSDRHFGVGSDGLILIKKSDKADFFMEMYNADGSQGQMCGNGIRCVGKFVYDNGLTDKTTVTIDTLAGVKILELKTGADGRVETARVNMGAPILEAAQIPVDTKELKEYKGCETETIAGQVVKTPVVDETIVVEGKEYKVTAVSMGNPHAIVYLDKDIDIKKFEIDLAGAPLRPLEYYSRAKCVTLIQKNGGESGIRTHGALPHGSFQDCFLKPLGHLSSWAPAHAVPNAYLIYQISSLLSTPN